MSDSERRTLAREGSPTHADLVARAERWLRNTKGCGVVFTERRAGAGHESPDAIGWRVGVFSILVECKVSRSDFRADSKKPHRIDSALGMGQTRYYLTPPGLLKPEELPEGWGLIETRGRIVREVVPAKQAPLDESRCRWELAFLVSAMRRVQLGCEPTYGIVAPVLLASPLSSEALPLTETVQTPCPGSQSVDAQV